MTEMRYLEVNGDRIAYRDEGQGETLLLVHGMAGSSETWRDLIPRLAEDYRVVAPDLLGHGRVRQAPRRLLARCVRGLAAGLHGRTRHPAGHGRSASRSAAVSRCSSPISTASAATGWC